MAAEQSDYKVEESVSRGDGNLDPGTCQAVAPARNRKKVAVRARISARPPTGGRTFWMRYLARAPAEEPTRTSGGL
eukprot:144278-Amphidinium_carterae.1